MLANIGAGQSETGSAVRPDGERAYVVNFDSNTVSVIVHRPQTRRRLPEPDQVAVMTAIRAPCTVPPWLGSEEVALPTHGLTHEGVCPGLLHADFSTTSGGSND